MIQDILVFTGGSAVLIGALGFLARSIIQHFLDKDINLFKLKLQAEADKRHFVFQHMYEKKLEIVSVLYEKSVQAGGVVKFAVQMQGDVKEEDIPGLEARIKEFRDKYEVARLWLDDECCNTIDKLLVQHSIFYQVVNAANLQKGGLGKDWIGPKLLSLWEDVDKDLPHAQEQLRRVFRETMNEIKPQIVQRDSATGGHGFLV